MKLKYFSTALLFMFLTAMKSDKPAYQFFTTEGKATNYEKVLKAAEGADIVLFGEMHDSPICHWLELELTKDLFADKKDNLVMGAEMFEADNQLILSEYMSDKISERSFEGEAKLWKNYKTDYKPLIEFARKNKIPFVATNVPRRYAALVNKEGFEGLESLDPQAKEYLPPLPIPYDGDLPGYKSMLEMMGGSSAHASANLPKAQAIKDATMAYFILKNWAPGQTFIHYNGSYHSENNEGIIWYLKHSNPDLKIISIASAEQAQIEELDSANTGKANFILAVPEDMTKTN